MDQGSDAAGRMRGLKKRPTQARSRARVESILSAAEELLADVGYAAVTTNAIAERAGAPIGSLYQYFDSKDDVLAELAARFEGRINVFARDVLTSELMQADLDSFFSALCEGLAEIQADHRSFVCVFSGSGADDPIAELAERLRSTLSARLIVVMTTAWPQVAERDLRRMLSVWSQIARAMISATDRASPAGRRETIEETALALSAYTREKLRTLGLDPGPARSAQVND